MSRTPIFEGPDVSIFTRETHHPIEGAEDPSTTVRLELKIGGWSYDERPDDEIGSVAMEVEIVHLLTTLGTALDFLVERRQSRERARRTAGSD